MPCSEVNNCRRNLYDHAERRSRSPREYFSGFPVDHADGRRMMAPFVGMELPMVAFSVIKQRGSGKRRGCINPISASGQGHAATHQAGRKRPLALLSRPFAQNPGLLNETPHTCRPVAVGRVVLLSNIGVALLALYGTLGDNSNPSRHAATGRVGSSTTATRILGMMYCCEVHPTNLLAVHHQF